jgi:phosphatidylglycerophosphate synthase
MIDLPGLQVFTKLAIFPNATWPTRVICYPIGARIAYHLSRHGITPNQVSLLGLGIALLPVLYALLHDHPTWLEAIALFFGLQLACILDCTDGVLARATNQASPFGAVVDKICDGFLTLSVPLFLLHIDATSEFNVLTIRQTTLLAACFVAASSSLTHALWFNSVYRNDDPAASTEIRTQTGVVYRIVTLLVDNFTTRTLLCLAWAFNLYVPFLVLFTIFNFVVFVGYVWKNK